MHSVFHLLPFQAIAKGPMPIGEQKWQHGQVKTEKGQVSMGCPWLAITRECNRPKEEFWTQIRTVHLSKHHDGSRQREDPKVDSEGDHEGARSGAWTSSQT